MKGRRASGLALSTSPRTRPSSHAPRPDRVAARHPPRSMQGDRGSASVVLEHVSERLLAQGLGVLDP